MIKLFSKILFIIFIITAFTVDSYSIVLHRDKKNNDQKSKSFDSNKTTLKDYNPDQDKEKQDVKLSKRYNPKMIIFNFENFTENAKNNYLVKLAAPSLTKKLKNYKKFNVEHVDIYFASVKIDDYTKYMKLLKKTASRYNADYIITGFVHKPENGVSIESLIYVTLSNSILKVNAAGDNLGLEYNDLIDELARKILGILKNENKKLAKEEDSEPDIKYFTQSSNIVKAKYNFIGMTGYFNLLYARKVSIGVGYMASGVLYWELASIPKVRRTKGARDLAIFGSIDAGRILTYFDILDQGSNTFSNIYLHYWGGVAGLMYKLKIKNVFVLDFGFGYGLMYSKTILAANYTGVRTFLLPTSDNLSTSTDHYVSMHFNFNVVVNPYFLFSFGISYNLITYSPQMFHGLAGRIGAGIKF